MRGRVFTILRTAFALGLTVWIFARSDPGRVASALAHVSWMWILAAVALVIADRALMAYRWLALLDPLHPHHRPPFLAVLRIFFISTFLGSFLPASVGTDSVRAWSLVQLGVPGAQSVASVLMDRLLGVVAILLTAAAGLALAPDVWRAFAWPLTGVGLACLAALAFVFSDTIDRAVRRVIDRLPPGRLSRAAGRLMDALHAYRPHHRMLAGVLGASVGVQVLRVLQAWLLGLSLGMTTPLLTYLAFIPVVLLVILLPVTVNGLGVGNWAFVVLFARAGVADATALALSVLFLALGIVGNLPGGLLYAVRPRKARAS